MTSLLVLALTATLSSSLPLRIWDRKYIESVGLVTRLNVVGVPSEARSLYVVDTDLSEAGTGGRGRHKRGLLDYFTNRPVYYPGYTSPGPVLRPGYTVTRPAGGGSRYGQPSLLASSGSLSPDTTSATLSASPWVTVPSSGSRFGQPSLLASSGQLTSNTKKASLSITPIHTSATGSRFGQPSVLASSGALSPSTTSAKLSVRPGRKK